MHSPERDVEVTAHRRTSFCVELHRFQMNVMRAIAADGEKPHVPIVFHAAKRRRFCYMIMTLLGENLKELKVQHEQLAH